MSAQETDRPTSLADGAHERIRASPENRVWSDIWTKRSVHCSESQAACAHYAAIYGCAEEEGCIVHAVRSMTRFALHATLNSIKGGTLVSIRGRTAQFIVVHKKSAFQLVWPTRHSVHIL